MQDTHVFQSRCSGERLCLLLCPQSSESEPPMYGRPANWSKIVKV